MTNEWNYLACPLPVSPDAAHVTLAHGEGGRLTRKLIADHLLPVVGNTLLTTLGDAVALPLVSGPLAFTTDSFVVSPLFFPGGDIGTLSVYGTVNDLVVSGARPRWLSLSLIIEEGLALSILDRVILSIADAAKIAGVEVVTGDTKVVPRGAVDQLFINTSGIGELLAPVPPGPAALQPGDELIVTGPIGRHGIAILASREHLGFEPAPRSDCGPLIAVAELLCSAKWTVRSVPCATQPVGASPPCFMNGPPAQERQCRLTKRRSRYRLTFAERANCWAWIHCTSPTKAQWCWQFPPDGGSERYPGCILWHSHRKLLSLERSSHGESIR